RIFSLSHHYDSLYHIVVVIEADLSDTGLVAYVDLGHIAYVYRRALDVIDNDVLNVPDTGQQSDPSYHISLAILLDHIPSYVDIAPGYGIVNLQGSNIIFFQQMRVDGNLVSLLCA